MKKIEKLIALNLAVVLFLSLLPVQALAVSIYAGRTIEYTASGDDKNEYTFTPETSGLYSMTIAAKTKVSSGYLELYDGNHYLYGLTSTDDLWTYHNTIIALTAGKEYTVTHYKHEDKSYAYSLSVSKITPQSLKTSGTVSYRASGETLVFAFTPLSTQWHTFNYSMDGSIQLNTSDFSGVKCYRESNIVSAYLTEGEQYYLIYNPYSTGIGTMRAAAVESLTINESYPYLVNKQKLTSITIGKDVKYINQDTFVGCNNLKSISVSADNPNYSSVSGVLFNKDKTELIWYPAAKDDTSYTVPNTVATIQYSAFNGSNNLMSVTVPSSVTSIGEYAFSDCSGLPGVTIPGSVTSIGEHAFSNCGNLTSISVSANNTVYDSRSNCNAIIETGTDTLCSGCKNTVIPSGVKSIGDYAFEYCSGLTNVTIPDSVTGIGGGAFYGCTGLTNVTIPGSVSGIGREAFCGCTSLAGASILDGVKKIGKRAFSGCSGLTSITIPESVTGIGYSAFYGCDSLNDVYYSGSEEQWNVITIETDNDPLLKAKKHYNSSGPGAAAQCIAFSPENGTVDFGFVSSGKTNVGFEALTVTYDKKLRKYSDTNYLAALDFEAGTIAIRRASDDKLIWKAEESYFTPGTSEPVMVSYSEDMIVIKPNNCSSLLDYGTEYYVTIDAGVIQFGDSQPAPAVKKGDWTFTTIGMNSSFSVSYPYTIPIETGGRTQYYGTLSGLKYDDAWFDKNSYDYNHDLATMTLGLVMSTFEVENDGDYSNSRGDRNVRELLIQLGFKNYSSEGFGAPDQDTVAVAIASKKVNYGSGKPVTILAVSLRGNAYGGSGWAGDFETGGSGSYHKDFNEAADYAFGIVKNYIEEHNINTESVKVWLTGYSRSAAVANLLSAKLSKRDLCRRENVYTYTFATPSNEIIEGFSSSYDNIFNILNPLDPVPMLPLVEWDFGKQGITKYLPSFKDDRFSQFESEFILLTEGIPYHYKYYQHAALASIFEMATEACDNRDAYYYNLQPVIMAAFNGDYSLIDDVFGNVTTLEKLKNKYKEIQDTPSIDKIKPIASIIKTYCEVKSYRKDIFGKNDPWYKLFSVIPENVLMYLMSQKGLASWDDVYLSGLIRDTLENGKQSALAMQHWPDVYMAWMLSCDESDLTDTDLYKLITYKCPVDVEVYDSKGNLVARTTTVTYSYTDEDTGESYTESLAVVDEDVTTIDAFTIGNYKYFVIPDDQDYRIKIVTNGTYQPGDTMTYTVTEYENGKETAAIMYEDIDLSEEASFYAVVTTTKKDIDTCTLYLDDAEVIPTDVLYAKDHQITDFNVERVGGVYSVTGTTQALEKASAVYCAVYDENGQMLGVGSSTITASSEAQDFIMSVPTAVLGACLKVFLTDSSDGTPQEVCFRIEL